MQPDNFCPTQTCGIELNWDPRILGSFCYDCGPGEIPKVAFDSLPPCCFNKGGWYVCCSFAFYLIWDKALSFPNYSG